MSQSKNFRFGNHTDVGRVRQQNEDYMGFFENRNGAFFVVCDGMGGHVGGAIASQTAVNNIRQFFDEQLYSNPQEAIYQALQYANSQIYQKALTNPDLRGMGTTCVLLMVRDNLVYHGHVGDSRIYLHRYRQLKQLTRDHSFVQALIEQGLITEAEAENHPRRNELLRAMGTSPFVEVEVPEVPIQPMEGDIFMLCSDGLNGMVSHRGLEEILNSNMGLQHKALRLVENANQLGGTDNITVQLIEFVAAEGTSNSYTNTKDDYTSQDSNLGSTSPGFNSSFQPPAYVPPLSQEPEDIQPISEENYSKRKKKKFEKQEEVYEDDYNKSDGRLSMNLMDEVDYRPLLTKGFLILFALVFGYVIFKNTLSSGPSSTEKGSLYNDSIAAIDLQNRFYEYTGIQKVKNTYQKTKETIIKTKKNINELTEYQRRKRQALDSLFRNKRVRHIANTLSEDKETVRDLAGRYGSKVEWMLKANGVTSEEELAQLDSISIPQEAPRP